MSDLLRKKPEDGTHSFADLIKGLQYAVNSAQEMLAVQQISSIGKYFGADGTAKTQVIKNHKNEVVEVPLISLIPQNALLIDEVEINFTTKVNSAVEKQFTTNFQQGEVGHVDFDMSLVSSSISGDDLMRVTVKFKATQPPEGLARVIDEQNKRI